MRLMLRNKERKCQRKEDKKKEGSKRNRKYYYFGVATLEPCKAL